MMENMTVKRSTSSLCIRPRSITLDIPQTPRLRHQSHFSTMHMQNPRQNVNCYSDIDENVPQPYLKNSTPQNEVSDKFCLRKTINDEMYNGRTIDQTTSLEKVEQKRTELPSRAVPHRSHGEKRVVNSARTLRSSGYNVDLNGIQSTNPIKSQGNSIAWKSLGKGQIDKSQPSAMSEIKTKSKEAIRYGRPVTALPTINRHAHSFIKRQIYRRSPTEHFAQHMDDTNETDCGLAQNSKAHCTSRPLSGAHCDTLFSLVSANKLGTRPYHKINGICTSGLNAEMQEKAGVALPFSSTRVGYYAKIFCEDRLLRSVYARRRAQSARPANAHTTSEVKQEQFAPARNSSRLSHHEHVNNTARALAERFDETYCIDEGLDTGENNVHDATRVPTPFSNFQNDIPFVTSTEPGCNANSGSNQVDNKYGGVTGVHDKSLNTCLSPSARFRLVVWITVCLRRLLAEIIRLSSEKTLRSASELQWMAVYAEKHDASLAFNKHLFSRDRVMAHIPDWAQTILCLPPSERSNSHCRKLHALLRGLKSFDKFTDEIQMSLCRAFTLERVEEGRIVLKNGHVGLNFYFIYSGSVFVNQEEFTKQGRLFSKTVATLTRGDSFGELALLQDIRRTATVSVRERCELLVVDRDVFASVCPRIFDKELAEKHAFIKTLDLFSSNYWSDEAIHSLSMNSQIQEFKTNKIIVGDSSMEDWVYICMVGKCQMIRCLSLDKQPTEEDEEKKESDIVLSEEILQLLAHTGNTGTSGSIDRGDSKENMLSSLQLDYVKTSKKLYLNNDGNERHRALLGLDEASTLTSFMRRQREQGRSDLVYLSVGVLEAGHIFDLPSLLEPRQTYEQGASILMLVSGGARMVRIKKAAFHDQASQQALENARTIASKQHNPTDNTILESYKTKVAWEDFKSTLVKDIKHRKHQRYQGSPRAISKPQDKKQSHKNQKNDNASNPTLRKSMRIISVLESIRARAHSAGIEAEQRQRARRSERERKAPSTVFNRRRSLTLEDMRSAGKQDVVIIRRAPSGVNQAKTVCKKAEQATTPRTLLRFKSDYLHQTVKVLS